MNSSASSEVRAVLLAGGLGTRLRPITLDTPKCLVPIADRPLLDYWFDLLEEADIRDVLINNHHLPDQVREYIASKNAATSFQIVEAYEPELLGSAGTIHANRDFADGAELVAIIYADNLSDVDLRELIAYHRSHDDPATMMLFRAPVPRHCGIATLDTDRRVIRFVEKPEEPESDLANAGLYVVSADAYHEIADADAFDLGFDVLPRFINRMRGWLWDGYHKDVGTHEALDAARRHAETHAIEGRLRRDGRP